MLFLENENRIYFINETHVFYIDPNTLKILETFKNPRKTPTYTVKIWKDCLVWRDEKVFIFFNTKTNKYKEKAFSLSTGYGFTIYNNYFIPCEMCEITLIDGETLEVFKTIETPYKGTKFCIESLCDTLLSGYTQSILFTDLITGESEEKFYTSEYIFNINAKEKERIFVYGTYYGNIGIVDLTTRNLIHSFYTNGLKRTIQYIEIFEDTICYVIEDKAYIYYNKDDIQETQTQYCSFLRNGDVILGDEKELEVKFEVIRIIRPKKHLQKLRMIQNYDIYFYSK